MIEDFLLILEYWLKNCTDVKAIKKDFSVEAVATAEKFKLFKYKSNMT